MITRHLHWDDIYKFVQQVSDYYGDYRPSGVYGLPRGGLVPAVMISHALRIPLLMAPARDCIVVDDICDGGDSLLHYSNMGYDVAVVIANTECKVKPTLYYQAKEDGVDWLVFPWELNHAENEIDALEYNSMN